MSANNLNLKGIDSVLFVCMGNICRSPTAEAVFRHKATKYGLALKVDSAGTVGAHVREKPDHRSQKAGLERGYSFNGIKARKVLTRDFEDFDLILAMDNENLNDLFDIAPNHLQNKVMLFLDFAHNYEESEVPDPYYGGANGFRFVLDLIEDASDGLLEKLL
ncbi:MAG: low molecular weight protein-tyrosine-phosphatase [Litorilituus sp.]|nr:low molecular weight protein-tyrosine-phosphatase [Litorilituus sp.]